MAANPPRENIGQQASADEGLFLLPVILLKGNGAISGAGSGRFYRPATAAT